MRAALAIAVLALLCTGCNTLREATQVAVALTKAPTEEQIDAQTHRLSVNIDAADAKLKAMQAAGHQPTDAEMKQLAQDLLAGKIEAPASPTGQAPPDQEISVNLVFAGLNPVAKNKELAFDFKALWGKSKSTGQELRFPVKAGSSEAKLDLGEARLRVIPKIVDAQRGRYEVELTDPKGVFMGRFNLAATGKQVLVAKQPTKYETELIYFHPERRLTGFTISKPGSRQPELGVIFVGKGWSFVENAKKPDMSKGYLFPEMDIVVLPKAWLNDHEMKDTCNTLKRGEEVAGGVCYS